MEHFSYDAPAELFLNRRYARSSQEHYRRFTTAIEAIRYIIEDRPAAWLNGSVLEVDEVRYEGEEIRTLYEARNFPRPRQQAAA